MNCVGKKESAFDVASVANVIINSFNAPSFELTNLKLQKVIYYIHGYYLARFDRPLIRNHFECWDHGPVVASLYHKLKVYGEDRIDKLIQYQNYATGNIEAVAYEAAKADIEKNAWSLVLSVTKRDVWDLVDGTHLSGGAWSEARTRVTGQVKSVRIPDHLIRQEFACLFGDTRLH